MTASVPTSTQTDASGDRLAEARVLMRDATTALLGHTIAVSDGDWGRPSRLPNWSRGHVATHVARQADALVRLCRWARTGHPESMYVSHQQRDEEIESGAGRSGLELQVDLDATAEALTAAFDEVATADAWDAPVEMRGGLRAVPRLLPLARLTEVVLHHVDLDIGFGIDDVDETTAAWLLEWSAFRLRQRDEFPSLELSSTGGQSIRVGSSGAPRAVRGSNARLLGWLTGRCPPSAVDGAGTLRLPPF